MDYSRDQKEKTVDVTVKTNLQPTKRLSQQEMNDRRSKDLCYLCDEKYTPEHYAVAHKKTQLFCMGVEDEFEDAEEKLGEVEEVVNNTSEPMPRISVNAVSGISDYDTMRAEEPPKSVADEVHVQPIELVVRDQAQEARSDVVSSPGVSVTRVGAIQSQPCIFGRANYVWKPGELEQCVQVQENRVQHERNKAEGVEFFVQRIDEIVTAVVVYDKRSDRVWEPGGLPTKLNMWDWTEKHPENFQPFHQNQVFDELEVVESKSSTNPMLGSMLKRHHKRQQVKTLRLSPKPWLFKFKQKLIRLKIRDKEFQIAMPLAPKILKVHHMLNSLVIAEAAAPIYSTIEYLSQFASKVGIDKEHSTSSLKVKKHDNLSWKEDESGSICCILKLGGVAITCKNVLEKIYAENLEIMACRLRPAMMESSVPSKVIGRDGSKRHGRSEIFCEVDAFGNQESSKFQKFAVAFRDISTVAKTQGLGFVHVLHKDAVLDSKLGYLIGNMREEDQKQQGDSELLVIVLECVDAKGGVGMDKKPFHLSLRNHRVWDPGGCISELSRFC